jgi:hypothetical protein
VVLECTSMRAAVRSQQCGVQLRQVLDFTLQDSTEQQLQGCGACLTAVV